MKQDHRRGASTRAEALGRLRPVFFLTALTLSVPTGHAQEHGRWNFNIGGGLGFPVANMSSFVNMGGHFVIGGGYNVSRNLSVDTEFMWQDLPINSTTKRLLGTPGASARQYSWTFNPIIHFPIRRRFGAYAVAGIGWYHRSGETTTPGIGVICNPYWSWWYGCVLGSVDIVTASRSQNSFGENIGGGITYPLGEHGAKLYTEVRYHSAFNRIETDILPLTFGIRW